MHTEELQKRIMRRVRFVAFCKRLYRPAMIRVAMLVILLAIGSAYASVVHIVSNMSSIESISSFYSYIVNAFINTEVALQLSVVGILMIALWALVDSVKNLSGLHHQTV